eukprot:SAG25_NODE_377_length_8848_cov_2.965367_4_plen_85_part_00
MQSSTSSVEEILIAVCISSNHLVAMVFPFKPTNPRTRPYGRYRSQSAVDRLMNPLMQSPNRLHSEAAAGKFLKADLAGDRSSPC